MNVTVASINTSCNQWNRRSQTEMARQKFHYCFLIFCVSNIALIPNCCHAKTCLPGKHDALFVFGDSLFDVGNNNYLNSTAKNPASYPPYGENFFRYPSGRFSDGRLIPDFIAEYANLPFIQPYLFPANQQYIDGVNFASAGAGALVETHQGSVIDLKTQLSYFERVTMVLRQKLGKAETKSLLGKAVYLISIGSNDYAGSLSKNSSVIASYTPQKYVDLVIGNLTTVIKGIYKKGGRKFGFLNVGPLGCLPSVKSRVNGSGPCREEVSELAKLHNSALIVALQKLEKQLSGFKYSITNFYDSALEVIINPSKFGFKEGGEACCGSGPYRGYDSCGGKRAVKDYELCENPNDYVFFDSTHPTERANKIFSMQMWSGSQSITGPYNLKTLFEQ